MKTYRRIWFIVAPRFPAISSPVTIESCRKALVGALEESPILPAGMVLSGPENGLPGLTCRRRVNSDGRQQHASGSGRDSDEYSSCASCATLCGPPRAPGSVRSKHRRAVSPTRAEHSIAFRVGAGRAAEMVLTGVRRRRPGRSTGIAGHALTPSACSDRSRTDRGGPPELAAAVPD